MDDSLFAMHIPGGNHADQGARSAQGEADVEPPSVVSDAQCVITLLQCAVSRIGDHQLRLVEEDLLGLGLAYAVLVNVLAGIPFIPVEPRDTGPSDHPSYIAIIYSRIQRAGSLGANRSEVTLGETAVRRGAGNGTALRSKNQETLISTAYSG